MEDQRKESKEETQGEREEIEGVGYMTDLKGLRLNVMEPHNYSNRSTALKSLTVTTETHKFNSGCFCILLNRRKGHKTQCYTGG